MSNYWLFIVALTTVGALVFRGHTLARLSKRQRSSTWAAFWREHYRPGHHKVGVLLDDTRYVGTVRNVDEVVATGNVWLEDVTLHDIANVAVVRLDASVCFTKDQPFGVYLVDE